MNELARMAAAYGTAYDIAYMSLENLHTVSFLFNLSYLPKRSLNAITSVCLGSTVTVTVVVVLIVCA